MRYFISKVMNFAGKVIDFKMPEVMGILNVTPDSFSDGGELLLASGKPAIDKIMKRAESMHEAGAAFIDIGGESTRPGANKISDEEEMERVLPLVEKISKNIDVVVSVDTSSPALMQEAAKAGAGLINDVRALQRPGAVEIVSRINLPVCLMHMQGEPATMQQAPSYNQLLDEILDFLKDRIAVCTKAGIDRGQIIVDPGFGFGKTAEQNFELLARLEALCNQRQPVLVGLSRKSMISSVLDRPPEQRMVASVALALMAVERGARIVRVHDVAATFDALSMWQTIRHTLSQSQQP